jgi:hypothetical protein
MPYTVNHEALKKQFTWDSSREQEAVGNEVPEGWTGTKSGGLPVK